MTTAAGIRFHFLIISFLHFLIPENYLIIAYGQVGHFDHSIG